MITRRKPTQDLIRLWATRQATQPFTYVGVGGTASEIPAGYVIDRTRVSLGHGSHIFEAARQALRQWKQFRFPWLEVPLPETPIQEGAIVPVLARLFGHWWLNFCRIVYVVDQKSGPVQRFGFAYGTLPEHAETGEERFLLEWDTATDEVFYDILAFSRPRFIFARLARPLTRRIQKRFGRDSAAAMQAAVAVHNS